MKKAPKRATKDRREGEKINRPKGVELTRSDLSKLGVTESDMITEPSDDLEFSGEPSG
jgi:hypothetical protein